MNVKVSVNVSRRVKGVAAVPEMWNLPFEMKGNRVDFVLPQLAGHQLISIDFA